MVVSDTNGLGSTTAALLVAVLVVGLAGCGDDVADPDNQQTHGPTYSIYATVAGLEHGEIVLEDESLGEAVVDAEGTYPLFEDVETGTDYDVTIVAEPQDHDCQLDNAAGTVQEADVDDIGVDCEFDEELDPAVFEISIDESASQTDVLEGETAIVAFEVANVGEREETREIGLEIADRGEVASDEVELVGGGSEAMSLNWETEEGDVGSHEATVETEDAADSTTVTVDERPVEQEEGAFEISIDESASTLEIEAGDTAVVQAEVTNTEDWVKHGDVQFSVDDQVVETTSVDELEGGMTTTVEFDWETDGEDVGQYTAEVAAAEHSDEATIEVADPDVDATLGGTVVDADTDDAMAGLEVVLDDQETGDEVDRRTVDDQGEYLFGDIETGDYELWLEAPGLNPDYELTEAGETFAEVSVEPGLNVQDLSVDWLREFDLLIDGGQIDFRYDDPDSLLVMDLPGCEEQSDGTWAPTDVDPDHEDVEVEYAPADECFRAEDVGVDLEDGTLEVTVDDLVFPDVEIEIDDEDDDEFHEEVDTVEVDFEWLVDGVSGALDYTEGSMDVELDFRILTGGTVYAYGMGVHFGANPELDEPHYDCQFTGAWGGDVDSPTEDSADEQIGEYLHDSVELNLTTGESGPGDAAGAPYEADDRVFVTVDNAFEVGRLSEGELAGNDEGGASCGELEISLGGVEIEEDFAERFNEFGDLPAEEGSIYGEFEFLLP